MGERRVSVIIAASGRGERFGGNRPKQFALLGGVPILTRTLRLFDGLDCIDEIIVAVPEDYVTVTRVEMAGQLRKVKRVISGGRDRQTSVYKALRALGRDTEIVLIHDGVRPFTPERTIREVIACAARYGAAVAGVRATDTVKITDAEGCVMSTPSRDSVWTAQTPQGFTYEIIKRAHEQAYQDGFTGTDDAMLVERLNRTAVRMVAGGNRNIKITTPEDLTIGEALLYGDRL